MPLVYWLQMDTFYEGARASTSTSLRHVLPQSLLTLSSVRLDCPVDFILRYITCFSHEVRIHAAFFDNSLHQFNLRIRRKNGMDFSLVVSNKPSSNIDSVALYRIDPIQPECVVLPL